MKINQSPIYYKKGPECRSFTAQKTVNAFSLLLIEIIILSCEAFQFYSETAKALTERAKIHKNSGKIRSVAVRLCQNKWQIENCFLLFAGVQMLSLKREEE